MEETMADREKTEAWMKADYLPVGSPAAEHRIANALEYIAYHIGQIDKKMDTLSERIWQISR
jgi:hypothetical protein